MDLDARSPKDPLGLTFRQRATSNAFAMLRAHPDSCRCEACEVAFTRLLAERMGLIRPGMRQPQ